MVMHTVQAASVWLTPMKPCTWDMSLSQVGWSQQAFGRVQAMHVNVMLRTDDLGKLQWQSTSPDSTVHRVDGRAPVAHKHLFGHRIALRITAHITTRAQGAWRCEELLERFYCAGAARVRVLYKVPMYDEQARDVHIRRRHHSSRLLRHSIAVISGDILSCDPDTHFS